MNIKDYGWNDFFQKEFDKLNITNLIPGRILTDFGQNVRVYTKFDELLVEKPINRPDLQYAVGDWIAIENINIVSKPTIKYILPRKTKFSRAASGIEVKEQIVAANIDTVFIMQSLNKDFNLKRLERYLIASWESGAIPVIILTKSDCCNNVSEKILLATDIAPGVEIFAISNITKNGFSNLLKYFDKGKTIALLGSSGVGKSTFVNSLLNYNIMKTQEIREDDSKGRHTTTHRELIYLPDGGLIIDTPGMRTLSLWESESGMDIMFGEIEKLITTCRFYDCTHNSEPGCAIRISLNNGTLDQKKWASWLKLQKEIKFLENKKNQKLKQHDKEFGKMQAKHKRNTIKRKTNY
ncbi:MAG: ribosome small subunit-dependent GTPase A [Clostridiales bacterium]